MNEPNLDNNAQGKPFVPPTAEQMVSLFDKHPPMPRTGGFLKFHFVLLMLLIAMLFWRDNIFAQVLPWIVLLGVFGFHMWRAYELQQLELRVTRVSELAALRHYANSLRLAWGLVPQLTRHPEMHGRTIGVMAFSLDQIHSFEAAIVAYDYLLDRLPKDHPTAVQLGVQRSIAQLENDQLADADDALRRLRGMIENFPNSALSAGHRFAELLQRSRTNHFDDVLADEDAQIEKLRALGTEAGFAYGLIAHAHLRMRDRLQSRAGATPAPDDAQANMFDQGDDALVGANDMRAACERHVQAAQLWWHRATLLLAESALVRRLPELKYVVEQGLVAEPVPFEKP